MHINQPLITANNSTQNLGQANYDHVNMAGNLAIENPTIEQFNAGVSSAQTQSPETMPEPAFGEHVREAAGVLRRIFR